MPPKTKLAPQPSAEYSTRNTETESVAAPVPTPPAQIVQVPLANISRWSGNPRQEFDEERLHELAESLRVTGLLSPLIVRPIVGSEAVAGPCYQIVAGERRWRAAHLAGLESLPCVVRDVDDLGALKIAIIENDQRDDVNPMERARGYQRLTEAGMTQEALAGEVKRSQGYVASSLKLLRLPEAVQAQIGSGALSPSHAEVLFKYSQDPAVLEVMTETIRDEKIPVRELEKALPRPITDALKKKRLVRIIENYGEPFDAKICDNCPFHAMRRDAWGTRVCFHPKHYDELKKAGREAEKEKVETAVAKVREQTGQDVAVRTNDLRGDQYDWLPDEEKLPEGCSLLCECRQLALNNYQKVVPICRNPKRLQELQTAHAARLLEKRKAFADARFAQLQTLTDGFTPEDARARRALAWEVFAELTNCASSDSVTCRALLAGAGMEVDFEKVFRYGAERGQKTAFLEDLANRGLVPMLRLFCLAKGSAELREWVRWPSERQRTFLEWMLGEETGQSAAVQEAEADDEDADENEWQAPDEDVETCARCQAVIAPDLLGVVVTETHEYRNAEGETRRHETLESGVLVIDEDFFYCAGCAPGVATCKACGCTEEAGCAEGCFWVEADLCSACSHKADPDGFASPVCIQCGTLPALAGGLCHKCIEATNRTLTAAVGRL